MKRRGFLQGLAVAIAFVSAAASGFGATVANVCSKVVPGKRRIPLPPIPKWNKDTDDIDRLDYWRRSEDLERSFFPRDLVFPREGQVWEVVRDCEVYVRAPIRLRKMVAFGNKVKLRKGERVRILPVDHPKPLQVAFHRLNQGNDLLFTRMARTVPGQGEEISYFSDLFRLVGT